MIARGFGIVDTVNAVSTILVPSVLGEGRLILGKYYPCIRFYDLDTRIGNAGSIDAENLNTGEFGRNFL